MMSRQFLRSVFESLASFMVIRVLATNRTGAAVRRWGLILIGGLLWVFIAAIAHPFTPSTDFWRSALEYPFQALFSANVFKHVLIGALAFWLAYRAGANYLQDIFELMDIRVAERFIRQAAFASQYDVIEILDGGIAEKDQKSPVFQIGGPGMVRVYLENAALFERIDGRPRVIAPTTPRSGAEVNLVRDSRTESESRTRNFLRSLVLEGRGRITPSGDGVVLLEGFERLRSVVDLRDKVETMAIFERTRDGIPIHAKDLRFIFSIRRDGRPPSLMEPYPFIPRAFEDLVYFSPRNPIIPTISSQIRRELTTFISTNSLGEFLAAIGWPEVIQDGQPSMEGIVTPAGGAPPPFVPRPEISDLFYNFNRFLSRVRDGGVELRWIGIGTWVLPDGIIPERHVQAWRLTQENLATGSRAAMEAVNQESLQKSSLATIRRTPIQAASELNLSDETARQRNLIALINSYRRELNAARDIYRRRDQLNTPEAERLLLVWDYLTRLVTRYPGGYPREE